MNERELLADCLRRLNRTGVTYYLTGSMASNYWGIPRATHDLDFVIQLPSSAVAAIVREFSGDYSIDEAAVRAAYQPPRQFNAIDTRSALKVDFWLPKTKQGKGRMLKCGTRHVASGEKRRHVAALQDASRLRKRTARMNQNIAPSMGSNHTFLIPV